MPVIVDEVVISIEVTNDSSGGSTAPPSPTEDKQSIVSECVERVLEILTRKGER